MFFLFLAIIFVSLFGTFRYRKPWMLAVPVLSLFLYMIVLIAMVPMGFVETVQWG